MAEAVILWAIKSLECWLRKKGALVEENLEKLYSLIVGMSDLGEEKEMVYSLLLHFGMDLFEYEGVRNLEKLHFEMGLFGYEGEGKKEKLCRLTVGMSDLGEEKKEMLHRMLCLTESKFRKEETVHMFYELLDLNKEKMKSLVVGMADFWEDNNEKLYALLFLVAVIWEDDKGESYRVLFDRRAAYWRELKKEKLHRLLVEITDLWGDDEGELNKENLHSLLFQMLDWNNYSKKKVMCRISGDVAGLWKDKQPKLNKEKLYTWFANKLDLSEPEKLFAVLLYASSHVNKEIREDVDGAKREFIMILDFITELEEESSLRYFISDVLDIAHHAHSLIHLNDSHPFALFCGLIAYNDPRHQIYYPMWFGEKFKHIVKGLQEIKDSMLGSREERLQNVREMTGGENVLGLEEDVKLLLLDDSYITVIKGMAGIGKTTLARQVYNHTNIAQQFQRRAWVCLSRVVGSRKEILVSLIRQLVDSNEFTLLEKIEHADYKSLKQMLRQQLMLMEQYFIVLDDVWYNTTHLMKYVMKALPKGRNSESRLLLTTRSVSIDNYGVYYHQMRCMDDDKSWILLLKTLSIEGSDEEFPKPLVKEARQILRRKCCGLPLAIKEVGRHWAKKRKSGSEWEELIESIDLSETLRALESS